MNSELADRLRRYYLAYTGGFVALIALLALLERHGMPPRWIGYAFLFFTIMIYAAIGIMSRTANVSEYYVAGRRVPAVFNGMATGADWMSAASFIGLAGTLYLSGYQGLAYVMGWTGGYVLVALFLAPYLRKFGQYTIPDFLAARYGGNAVRLVGVFAAVLASFVYVVAQIYGVGLIASRFVGLQFEIGIFLGLAGILVCSFLGGMRAVTWTQVAQYVILIIAYIAPVTLLSMKVTSVPVPQLVYGEVLEKVRVLETQIFHLPAEEDARRRYQQRADAYAGRIERLPASLVEEKQQLSAAINERKLDANASMREVLALERQRRELPATPEAARAKWGEAKQAALERAAVPSHHAEAFPGASEEQRNAARINFLTLVFCLMVGTAALPHILVRYYTTPSVREARKSVFWSLLFILALYLTAPAYAVFAKYEIYLHLVNSEIARLPGWIAAWGKLGLVSIEDINGDGLLQLAELTLNPDVIVLATPEIAGLPYVVSGLVAAGALAAALSTADGLLLTITGALSHDVYYKVIRPQATTQWRLVISKSLLLVVAVMAAMVAAQKPATILSMVAWAFSIAGASFFPALVLGIFWRRANKPGAIAGMLAGLAMTLYYMLRVQFDNIPWLGLHGIGMEPWLEVQSTSAGVWGVPVGFVVIVVVSLLTAPPPPQTQALVERLRYPVG
ncbi:sodium:solute symporter family protein [Azospira restricta]|uniref:VC_2705 family sodium/solute symporter n=1 Tax=Azospira restricta TaxID=404405 RepID=A0A974SM76_9RHOO|nr:VC_2705 family sodium/solute symporter [Azospira restricta]QRJ62395.1 VC_2705 family sodium/solute symporter [Azospira restricta]